MNGKRLVKNISEKILKSNIENDLNDHMKLADLMNIEDEKNLPNSLSEKDDIQNGTINELYDSLDKKKNKFDDSNDSSNRRIDDCKENELKNEIIDNNNMNKNNRKNDIKNMNKNVNNNTNTDINNNNNNHISNNNNNSDNHHISNNSNYTNSTDVYEIQEFDLNVLEGGRGGRLCAKLKKIAREKDVLKKVRKNRKIAKHIQT